MTQELEINTKIDDYMEKEEEAKQLDKDAVTVLFQDWLVSFKLK